MRGAAIAGGGLAVALLIAGPLTGGGDAQEPQSQARTIELVARHVGGFRVDNRPRGASPGDLLGFRETLTSDGRRVGRGHGTCITVSRRRADCSVTSKLEDGSIVARFTQDFSKREITAAIVGGTGAYRAARGEATVSLGERSNRLVLRLEAD